MFIYSHAALQVSRNIIVLLKQNGMSFIFRMKTDLSAVESVIYFLRLIRIHSLALYYVLVVFCDTAMREGGCNSTDRKSVV